MKTKNELKTMLEKAMSAKDSDALVSALDEIAGTAALEKLAESDADLDREILAKRGQHMLTKEETAFYERLKEVSSSNSPAMAISNGGLILPETIIDRVMDDITQTHPLLNKLDIIRVNAKIKVLYTSTDSNIAIFGEITDSITKELSMGFEELDATALKLSAYMVIPNAYLKLNAMHIDALVTAYLREAMSKGLEKAVLTNLVSTTGPIGMMANLTTGQADDTNANKITYTAKTAIAVTEWTPSGLASVLSAMAKTKKGNPRPIEGLFLVVNPADEYTKVRPALMVQNASGEWVSRSPYPVEIIPSSYMTSGTAVLGMDKKYALGICTDPNGSIEYSDHFKFLDDARTYKTVAYCNGRPKDNNAFQVLTISGLKPAALFVTNVTNEVKAGGNS